MRIAVVGAGAVGTWLGAALARAGHEVALVARGAHLDAMRERGVEVRGADAFTVRPVVTGDPREVGPVDAVILSVKAHDQAVAGAALQPLLAGDTTIVAAQNGIPWWYFHGIGGRLAGRRVEAVDPDGSVSAVLDPARVLGMVVYVGAAVVAPGVVETRAEAGLVLGEPTGADSPRLQAVAGALESARFGVRVTPDIRTELWTKLMGNASLNQISVLTRAGLGAMARDPAVRAVVAAIMAEVVEIARATGANPTIPIEERLAITARLGDHRTSTLQDLEAGKRLELDAIAAAVVELADVAGIAAPTLRTVSALADLEARVLGLR
jgi:2-dehydropantoate 2-reductase